MAQFTVFHLRIDNVNAPPGREEKGEHTSNNSLPDPSPLLEMGGGDASLPGDGDNDLVPSTHSFGVERKGEVRSKQHAFLQWVQQNIPGRQRHGTKQRRKFFDYMYSDSAHSAGYVFGTLLSLFYFTIRSTLDSSLLFASSL